MFAEGELRDLVVQNLESCGFLNKIKAELRAGVFLALSDEESFKKKIPLFNKQLDNFLNTNEGKIAVSVVREFLEYFNLSFTLSVFDPEVSSSTANRKSLCEDLNLKETEFDGPILSALLKTLGTSKFVSSKCNEESGKKFQDLMDKSSVSNKLNEKSTLNSFQKSTKQTKDISLESSGTNKNSNTTDITSFSVNNVGNNRNFFDFSKPEEKDIFKDQSIDNFFDDPVPSEKSNIFMGSSLKEPKSLSSTLLASEKESLGALSKQKALSLTFFTSEKGSALNDDIKVSSFLTKKDSVLEDQKRISSTFSLSDKGSLSSLRDLPSLMKQDNCKNKELQEITNIDKEDFAKKDVDPESSEEIDRQMNSEESIEEEIEEEFSAGLDDLLNSSLSLGDDATSDQTVSQASVVDGVDHIEACNTVN